MIESSGGNGQNGPSGNILRMVHNPRLGGSLPTWVNAGTAKDEITRYLAQSVASDPSFKTTLPHQMLEPFKSHDE